MSADAFFIYVMGVVGFTLAAFSMEEDKPNLPTAVMLIAVWPGAVLFSLIVLCVLVTKDALARLSK